MSFDRIARLYRLVETLMFGRTLERARTAWLHEVAAAKRVLIVGEGDGRFLQRLLAVAPAAQVECVDGSAAMLALAAKRVAADPRVRFVQAALETYAPTGRYDLIVSHFVLDCFDAAGLERLIARLAAQLDDGGRWLLADFRVPHGRLPGVRARLWLVVMYAFFRVVTGLEVRRLVDPTPLLQEHGLERTCWRELDAGFVGSALWSRRG